MVSNAIFPALQSSYRQFHSTETALIKVINDILLKINSQHVTMLILLDLSPAFDTVDHQILLESVMTSYRHVTEISEHMVEIRKCCNFWPMFVRLKLGLKMLHWRRG